MAKSLEIKIYKIDEFLCRRLRSSSFRKARPFPSPSPACRQAGSSSRSDLSQAPSVWCSAASRTALNFIKFLKSSLQINFKEEKGQLLVELLIAIAILAIITVAVSQVTGVSFQSSKVGGQRTVALEIAQEELDVAKAVSKESWHNIYSLATSTPPSIVNKYHSSNAVADCGSVKWCLVSGDVQQVYNTVIYTKYMYIEDVSRTVLDIDSTYNAANNDPSTQKLTAIVSWQGGSIEVSDYLTRARNAGAVQTNWTGGACSGGCISGTGETAGFNDNTYFSAESAINTSGSTLKLNQQ